MLSLGNGKFYIFGLLLLNALPLLGYALDGLTGTHLMYFYWGESALLLAFVLMTQAKRLIVFCILLLLFGSVLYLIDGNTSENDLKVSLTFWSLYCLFWLAYIDVCKSRFWQKVRCLHPWKQLVAYFSFMGTAIVICFSLTATLYDGWFLLEDMPLSLSLTFLALATGIPTLAIGLLKIIDMIGPRHFLHFLFGTYYRPVEQDRIVMFLDMVDSSGMAEKLGTENSMRLIARFIFDTGGIIRRYGGDILNYTGDGLVVLWPRRQADKALTAVHAMRTRIQANSSLYISEFGMLPDFRIGMHAGKIVIGQIGEEKLFLALYGDVVNTAGRLEQMNKELNTKNLISKEVVEYLSQPWLAQLKLLGSKEIRGRHEEVVVYSLQEKEGV